MSIVLDPPLTPTPKFKYARFEVAKVEAISRPAKYMNPFFDLLPLLNQDGRGTCTGFAGAYTAWFNQLKLISPTPLTKEEVAQIKRDQQVGVFNQCSMRCDFLPKYTPSAEGFYDEGRRIGNVTVPEGGYIDCVAQAYKTYGYNYEKDRMTAHTNTCAPMYYPINGDTENNLKFLSDQAKNHRADNYVQISSWDGLKDAIYQYGSVIVAVNIFENYQTGGNKGLLPEPRGEVIGSHALCACGYDDELDVVYVIMSWGDSWSKLSGFSKNYYTRAEGIAFAPIVSKDTLDETPVPPTPDPDNHALVTITSNKLSTITVNTDIYNNTKLVKVMLHIGETYQISCSVNNTFRIREPTSVLRMETITEGNSTIAFTFQTQSISEYIQQKIKEILKRLKIIQKV
jgi:hypothetical protein